MTDLVGDLQRRVLQLEKRMRWQRNGLVSLGLAAMLLVLVGSQSSPPGKAAFTELDVERLNIVEPDGKLALVIANKPRLPDVILGGKELDVGRAGRRGPGMLFFNEEQDEVGGLVFQGHRRGDSHEAGAHFSFDQYNNDQVVYLSYQDDGTSRRSGLYVVDRPVKPSIRDVLAMQDAIKRATGDEKRKLEKDLAASAERGELGAERVFVGSNDGTAMLRLRDSVGRNRIRLYVDRSNEARLEFLDEKGEVVYSIPE